MIDGGGVNRFSGQVRRHAAIVMLIGALVLGGAGSQHPLVALVVTMLALAVATTNADRLLCSPHDRIEQILVSLAWLLALIVVIQIVPLPPKLWQHLPGRAIVLAVNSLQGVPSWRPLSLAPDLTLDIGLSLIAPLVAFGIGRSASQGERLQMIRLVIICAFAGAILGLGQLATGPDGGLSIWATIHEGSGVGWFVNRNHQAAFLLVAIVLGGVPGGMPFEKAMKHARLGPREHSLVLGGLFVLLAAGVFATLSRTGVALLPLALAISVGLRQRGRRIRLGLPIVVVLAVVLVVLGNTAVGDALMTRYGLAQQDDRFAFWLNTLHATRVFLPLGTGFGTFVGVYQMFEPLDQVGPLYVVHAHDDYLEWVLEGGWPIVGGAVAALGCLLVRVVALLREQVTRGPGSESRHRSRLIALAGLGAILILALASLTDFPLRMSALGVLFGLCFGFVANPKSSDLHHVQGSRAWGARTKWSRIAVPVCAGALTMLAISADVSQAYVLAGDGQAALTWAAWRAGGWSLRAQERLLKGQQLAAQSDAFAALQIDPLDQVAVRVAGVDAQARRQPRVAAVLANVAGQLGWRDLPTQVWLAERAEQRGDLQYEVQRVDALLRQHALGDRALDFFVRLVADAQGRKAIVLRLADSPGWAQGFFNQLAGKAGEEPDSIVALVDDARNAGVRMTPDSLGQVIWHLAGAKHFDAARAVRRVLGADANLGDADFMSAGGRLPDGAEPYHWQGNPASGGDVYIGPRADRQGQALHIVSDGRPVVEAARQQLFLVPGRYRISDRWASVEGDQAVVFMWEMRCLSSVSDDRPQDIQINAPGGDFVVPKDCDQQEVRLRVADATGKPFHVALQHVAIDIVR